MKLSQKKSVVSLVSACFLVGSYADSVVMKPNFKELSGYKNIAFGASIGGSSHVNWVLSIGEELGIRGHNVSFFTTTSETRFGQPFSHVQTIDIGPTAYYDIIGFMEKIAETNNVPKITAEIIGLMAANYERDFTSLVDYFKIHNIDIAMCDHFFESCMDAAKAVNIPYIVTGSMDLSKESAAPFVNNGMDNMDDLTSEFQTFTERFYNQFIRPVKSLYYFYPHIQKMIARKKALGLEPTFESPLDAAKHSLKLVNSLFGFSAARPVGSLAEYIGPIIPKQYKPLNDELKDYLDSHKNVAYIAFGQNAVPTQHDINFILTSAMESLEAGYIDGFLWATVHSAGHFPDTVTTASGNSYNVSDMFDHTNIHARMVKWAPQTAVLLHPNTALFVSHGGLGSWYESSYAGKKMIMYPFFGDQPGNSLIIERSKLGGILRKKGSIQEATALFKRVLRDEAEEIQSNVNRFQALTQIHSEHSIVRGADVVEEVAYTHKDNRLPHREPASIRMSYMKANNYDLYLALISLVATFFGVAFTAVRYLLISFGNKQETVKLKKY